MSNPHAKIPDHDACPNATPDSEQEDYDADRADRLALALVSTCFYCQQPDIFDAEGESTNLVLLDPSTMGEAMMCRDEKNCDARAAVEASTPCQDCGVLGHTADNHDRPASAPIETHPIVDALCVVATYRTHLNRARLEHAESYLTDVELSVDDRRILAEIQTQIVELLEVPA